MPTNGRKLTTQEAAEMRAAGARGERVTDLAARFGVTRQIVRLILLNKTYRDEAAPRIARPAAARSSDVGMSQAEIAQRLGMSRQLVAYYERRALAKMRAALGEGWSDGP